MTGLESVGQWELPELSHNDYPHEPGTLYDCMLCESECFCDPVGDEPCVHCALNQESEDMATQYDWAAWYSQDS